MQNTDEQEDKNLETHFSDVIAAIVEESPAGSQEKLQTSDSKSLVCSSPRDTMRIGESAGELRQNTTNTTRFDTRDKEIADRKPDIHGTGKEVDKLRQMANGNQSGGATFAAFTARGDEANLNVFQCEDSDHSTVGEEEWYRALSTDSLRPRKASSSCMLECSAGAGNSDSLPRSRSHTRQDIPLTSSASAPNQSLRPHRPLYSSDGDVARMERRAKATCTGGGGATTCRSNVLYEQNALSSSSEESGEESDDEEEEFESGGGARRKTFPASEKRRPKLPSQSQTAESLESRQSGSQYTEESLTGGAEGSESESKVLTRRQEQQIEDESTIRQLFWHGPPNHVPFGPGR